ncbi:hypothetical protein FQR65_LT03058 [Abscondita terminalis]|nr:hypothetical protein FQR65_LT03058 [Abscondita terminalis]
MYSILIVVFTLLSAVQPQFPINEAVPVGIPPDLLQKMSIFSSIYIQKCGKNLDESQKPNLNKAVADISTCVGSNASPEAPEKFYCASYGKKFLACLKSFADVGKGCLDANEKYLPDFIINAQSRVLDKYCTDANIARLSKLSDAKCKKPLGLSLNADLLEKCVPKLVLIENLSKKDYSLNKNDVCSDLKTMQGCILNTITSTCEIAKEDTDLINSVFQEYQKECGSFANINIASFGLLATLFLISKFFS